MSQQEYEEMMTELMNDPDYIAYCDNKDRETMATMDRLTDAEIVEIYGTL